MSLLNCPRCDYKTYHHNDMTKHVAKKYPCDMKLECDICNKKFKTRPNLLKHLRYCLKVQAKNVKNDNVDKYTDVLCENGKRYLAEKDNLILKHEELIASYITKIELLESKLSNAIIEHNTGIANIASGNGSIINENVNITNNITVKMPTIAELISSDLSYITTQKYREILNSELRSLEKFIEEIFFNPLHAENHNIFMEKQNSDDIFMCISKEWNKYDINKLPLLLIELLQLLIEKTKELSHDKLEIIPTELEKIMQEYIVISKELRLKKDKKKEEQIAVSSKIIKQIHKLLAHHNQIPIGTHKIKKMRKDRPIAPVAVPTISTDMPVSEKISSVPVPVPVPTPVPVSVPVKAAIKSLINPAIKPPVEDSASASSNEWEYDSNDEPINNHKKHNADAESECISE
jgi:hypothetical protein